MKQYFINPLSKPRMTKSDSWKNRPVVMNYWAYKDLVKLHKVEIPAACHIVFYIAMPNSWSEKKKLAMNDRPHQQTPDIDNILKGLL